jgi:hypothetical protein
MDADVVMVTAEPGPEGSAIKARKTWTKYSVHDTREGGMARSQCRWHLMRRSVVQKDHHRRPVPVYGCHAGSKCPIVRCRVGPSVSYLIQCWMFCLQSILVHQAGSAALGESITVIGVYQEFSADVEWRATWTGREAGMR